MTMDGNRNRLPNVLVLAAIVWLAAIGPALGDDGRFRGLPAAESHFYATPGESLPGVPAKDVNALREIGPDAAQLEHATDPIWESIPDSEPASTSPWQWHIRPRGFVYHTYWASAAEPRLSTQLLEERYDGSFLDSNIAGRFGILRFGPKDRPEGFQIDVLGGAKLRQDWDDGLDVLASDFRYDILGTYGVGPHRFKFGFYHVSAHTGDEFLLKHPDFDRLNFFRDCAVAGYSYYPIPQARIYAETSWAFDHEISEPWEFQLGLDLGPHEATGVRGAPFLAMNVHLREELDFGGNFAMQAGWAWRGEDALDGLLRTGVYFYEGASPYFSFYAEHERQVGFGIWYDY